MNNNSELLDIVPTKAVALKKDAISQFKAVVFESHKPKQSVNTSEKSTLQNSKQQTLPKKSEPEKLKGTKRQNHNKEDTDDGPEFNMKKARHEVMQFGISGLVSKNKKKAEIALAVKLGAKPPKKKYRNYKELLHQKKISKEIKEERLKLRQLGKNQTGAAVVRYKKPKLKSSKQKAVVGEISRHYGVVNPKIGKKK